MKYNIVIKESIDGQYEKKLILINSSVLQIEFFDLEGNLIPYDEQHVSISGHVGEEGVLGNLANGKTKVWHLRYIYNHRQIVCTLTFSSSLSPTPCSQCC